MNSNDSIKRAIGVAPTAPTKPAAQGARWTQPTNVPVLPDDIAADQCNVIQGRACVGEQPPNACRENS